jgi:hypothetical protein
VPAGIPAGVYDLTVQNPDGQFDTLSPAYTALVPLPPPTILSITPNQGYNDAPVAVVIQGNNFQAGVTASLNGYAIAISAATATTINGTVPAGIPVGVYDLTVQNPDGQFDTLLSAYTALDRSPTVLSITPNEGCNDAAVQVVIRGSNFLGPPEAWLGNVQINISAATIDTLTGTVPAGIPFGAYALTVRNLPGGQSDTLPSAYTVVCPNAPLETGNLVTFGPAAPPTAGDDDYRQEIFFHILTSYTGTLYIRIWDADTGAANDETPDTWNTTIRYTLQGSSVSPQIVIGSDAAYDDQWVSVFGPYQASELIDGNGVFSLLVEGVSGNDGNIYNVAVSTDTGTNTSPPGGGRIFAYSWTFPVYVGTPRWLYPYIPPGTVSFEQYNFDMDLSISMMLHTPTGGMIPVSAISDSGWDSSAHPVATLEDGSTWGVEMTYILTTFWNDVTFEARGDGAPLAIFVAPTTSPAP